MVRADGSRSRVHDRRRSQVLGGRDAMPHHVGLGVAVQQQQRRSLAAGVGEDLAAEVLIIAARQNRGTGRRGRAWCITLNSRCDRVPTTMSALRWCPMRRRRATLRPFQPVSVMGLRIGVTIAAKPGTARSASLCTSYFSRSTARQPMSRRQKPSGQSMRSTAGIGARLRLAHGLAERADIQHAAAIGENALAVGLGAGVEDLDALDLRGVVEAFDHRALVVVRRDSPSPPSPRSAPRRRTSADRNSSACPSRAASSAGTRSDISRSISTWHSGSPKRTLYSISFGPSVGDHQPGEQHALVRRAHRLHRAHGRHDDLVHHARVHRPASSPAPANRRPCRRCSGPCRRRTTRLWSCAEASGIAVSPSHSAKNDASSPSRNSSITTSGAGRAEAAAEHHVDGGFGLGDASPPPPRPCRRRARRP